MCFRRVPVTLDQGVAAQQALHGGPLHALAAAMNEPDLLEAGLARRVEILVNHRYHIGWREAVEIYRVLDWNVDGCLVFHC